MATPTTSDSPGHKLPAYTAMQQHWGLVRDVRGGTETLRDKKSTYLPKFEAEDARDWDTRVKMTFAYDAVDQTIGAMLGLAFMSEPELGDDVPEPIVTDWENIDGEGTHGTVFATQVLDSALQDGHCLILTDYPPAPTDLSLAAQMALELRAYLVRVMIDQVVSWRVMTLGGRRILGQVVIKQVGEVPAGAFGATQQTEYRVFRQSFDEAGTPEVLWERWTELENQTIQTGKGVIRGPKFIPLAVAFGGQRTGFLESTPPLLGLANSNIDHTQVKSDRRFSMHKCAIPVPVFIGRDKGPSGDSLVSMSSSRGIDINIGGDAKILEPQGTALAALREEILDIEKRMGDQGLAMVLPQDGASRTATEVQFTRTRQESKLARAVRSLQDALEASFGFMAGYYGLEDGGSLVLRRDFTALTLSDSDQTFLTSARERGDLTLATFLEFMRLKGGLFERLDPEAEVKAVAEEMGAEDMGLSGGVEDVAGALTVAAPADQTLILNGAQIASAREIVSAVAAGELPRDTGLNMLEAFFRMTPAQAARVMASAGTTTPTTPNPRPGLDDPTQRGA